MFDSTVKLHQINIPELSGFIISLIPPQSGTGIFNTFVNSGAITTGQTGNFVSLALLSSSLAAQNIQNNNTFYPLSNPSGFASSGHFLTFIESGISGINWTNNFGLSIFNIQTGAFQLAGPNSTIQFYSTNNNPNTTNPYISGFNIWANDIVTPTLNGGFIVTSGYLNSNFVNVSQFNKNLSTGFNFFYLIDSIKSTNSKFNAGNDFYLEGQNSVNISAPVIIDLYGSQTGNGFVSGTPYILGFNINANQLQLSGYNVLTALDIVNSGLVNKTFLLQTSGALQDNIDRIQTGTFYPLSNPSGFITGLSTGSFISVSQTGLFYPSNNPSGYITTGQYISGIFVPYISQINYPAGGNLVISGQSMITNEIGNADKTEFILFPSGGSNQPITMINYLGLGMYFYARNGGSITIDVGDNQDPFIVSMQAIQFTDAANATTPFDYLNQNHFNLGNSSDGNIRINLDASALIDANQVSSLDWQNRWWYDISQVKSADWANRLLLDYTAGNSVDWNNRLLIDTGIINSIDWQNRNLFDNTQTLIVDWQNELLYDNTSGVSIDWNNRRLVQNPSNTLAILDWSVAQLLHGNGFISIAWDANQANDGSGYQSIDWGLRNLNDNSNPFSPQISLDWNKRILSGNWTAQSLTISGSSVVLASQTGSFGNTTGNLTGAFYPLIANPSGYITTGQTGAFASAANLVASGQSLQLEINTLNNLSGLYYLKSNPSGFITGVNTGNFITTGQTGTFYPNYNPSGFITGINTGNFVTNSQLTGYFPKDIISGLSVFYSGYYTSPFSENEIIKITGAATNGSGHVDIYIGDTNSNVLTMRADNITPSDNFTYFQTEYFSIGGITRYSDGLLVLDFANGLASLGDVGGDFNETFITVDDNNGTIEIFGATYFPNGIYDGLMFSGANAGAISLNPGNRNLYNISSVTTLDWQKQILSGNWNAQNLTISGNSIATSNNLNLTGSGLQVSINNLNTWTGISTGLYYPLTGNPFGYLTGFNTGNFVTTGQSGLFINTTTGIQNFTNKTINSNNLTFGISGLFKIRDIQDGFDCLVISEDNSFIINDFNSRPTVQFYNRLLYDTNPALTISIDWANRQLSNTSGVIVTDWNKQLLYNGTNTSLDWQNQILSGNWTINSLTNGCFIASSPKIDFTKTGNYTAFTVPNGKIFMIDSMEIVTSNISIPSQAPYISFGASGNYGLYTSPIQTVSNSLYARHILENPQDGIVSGTVLTASITTGSTAALHSGYMFYKGFLINA